MVMAAFLVHLIGDGVSFSFGVLYPIIQDYYNASKGESGIVASLFFAVPLLTSPSMHYIMRFCVGCTSIVKLKNPFRSNFFMVN